MTCQVPQSQGRSGSLNSFEDACRAAKRPWWSGGRSWYCGESGEASVEDEGGSSDDAVAVAELS